MKKYIFIILASVMILTLAACGGDDDEAGTVIVSGKKYTEQIILANIMGEYLKANTDMEVVMEDDLGSVFVLQEAMKKGEIDMYVEYTGTAFENVIDEEYDPEMSTDEIYDITREKYEDEFNMTWLDPLGFNNTYILALRTELYDDLGIETLSELAEHAEDLSFGAQEFFERSDGYDALIEAYDYKDGFGEKIVIAPDLMYQAAKDAEIDIITAFATEARLDQFDLKTLEDDKGFFPPYDAGVVIRQEILDANEGLEDDLNELAGMIDNERMRELNGRVNIDGKQDNEVAREFLDEEGFLD